MNSEINAKEWAENFKKKIAEREKEKAERKEKVKQEMIRSLEKLMTSRYEIIALYESGKVRLAHSLDELPNDQSEYADSDRVLVFWVSKHDILESLVDDLCKLF
jgi:actin-related protein